MKQVERPTAGQTAVSVANFVPALIARLSKSDLLSRSVCTEHERYLATESTARRLPATSQVGDETCGYSWVASIEIQIGGIDSQRQRPLGWLLFRSCLRQRRRERE